MKRCPTCNRIYPDDALSFCLEDGVPLLNATASDPGLGNPGFDPNATLNFEDPRDTSPPPTQIIDQSQIPVFPLPGATSAPPTPYVAPTTPYVAPPLPAPEPPRPPSPTMAAVTPARPEPAWTPPIPVTPSPSVAPAPPPKKSMLPWLLGGGALLGLIALGIAGIVIWAAMSNDNKNGNNANNSNGKTANVNGNANKEPDNKNATANTKTDPPPVSADGVFKDDFSQEKWPVGADGMDSEYADGQYVMQHTVANQFIVNYSPDDTNNYSTNGVSSVSVDVEALDSKAPQLGYGLVLHGSLTGDNKTNGYAFILDTSKKPQCAIIQLRGGNGNYLVAPKPAPMILPGEAENHLEVKLAGKKMDFYINDQLAASIPDKGDLQGRVGLYTSNGGQIGFDNLEITK